MVTTKRPFRPPRLAAFSVLPASLLLAVAPLSAQTPPSAGCIHAASLPIRICGASEEEQPRAAGLLALAERCWQAAVGALGLTEPWRLDTQGAPEPGLSLEFVDDPLQPAAELQPLADVPGTPHADCATRLALGRGFPVDLQQRQLVYELLRAMQAADDCAERQQELVPHYLALLLQERLGLAGEGGSAEYVAWLNDHFLGIFQANPDFSLDFTTPSMTELDLYPVGQTLFAMYLDQRWGSGDGRLLARALHAGRQEGSVIVRGRRVDLAAGQANEPDLYDALDLVLAEQGGSFWQAVAEFGVWRFFCGAFADGDHLRHAGLIRGAAVAAMHGLDQLPLQEQLSPREPQETGSVYIDLELAGLPGEANEEQLLFELRSDGGEAWYLAALVFDGAGGHRLVEGGAQEGGTARLVAGGLAGMQHVVFLVTCLGDQLHDPDERDWATVPFRYSLRRISVPRVDQVQPARLRQGEQDVALLVRGAGFVPGIAAQLGPGIAVKELLLERTGSELMLLVDVAPDAAVGWRPLELSHDAGVVGRLEQGVEVVAVAPPELLAVDPSASPAGSRLFVALSGRGLQPGGRLALSGGGVRVLRLDRVDERQLVAELSLDAGAAHGPRDLLLTQPDGQQAALSGGFTVLPRAAAAPADGGGGEGDGDGCRLAQGHAGSWPPRSGQGLTMALALALALALLPVLRPRRRGPKRRGGPSPAQPGQLPQSRLPLQSLLLALLLLLPALAHAGQPRARAAQEIREEFFRLLAPPAEAGRAGMPRALPPAGEATQRRLAAFRLLAGLPAGEREELRHYLAAPVEGQTCLTSERLPMRACYPEGVDLGKALFLLAEAEHGWDEMIDGLGFWPPRREGDTGPEMGIDLYLGDAYAIGAAGYTSPVDYDPSTAHFDCTSYIVVEQRYNPGPEMARTIRHELNHACQMAMDCAETPSSMEATSVWLETALSDQPDLYFYSAIANFQNHPERGINWNGADEFYKYGSALFLRFVHEHLGQGDPRSITRLWEATMQYDQDNEPDLLDAVLDLAAQQGRDFAGLIEDFGEWRFFVGTFDDGRHFTHGAQWQGAQVRIAGQLVVKDEGFLPLTREIAINPLGYWFADLQVQPEGLLPGGLLSIGGARDSTQRWALTLWQLRPGEPARTRRTVLDRHSAAPILVAPGELAPGERLVLMVANVQEDVDWDGFWSDRRFQLAVDYRVAPRLVAVTPDTLAPGDRAVLRLTGSGFAAGVRVEVRGEGVELHDCRRIDGRQIDCSVLVHEDARPGARNLVVANDPEDAGQSSTLHSALQIAPAEPLELRELRPDRAAAGAELLVQLAGRGLGPGLQPRLSCPGVEVAGLHPVSTRLLYLALRLAASAPPGPCSLELADGRARRSTLPDAFFVLPPAADVDGAGSGSQAEGEGCRLAVPAAAPQPVTAPGRLAGSLPGSPLPGSPLPGSPLPGSSLPGSPLPGSPLPGSPPPALLLQGLLLLLPLLALRLRRLHRPPRPGRAQRGPRRR